MTQKYQLKHLDYIIDQTRDFYERYVSRDWNECFEGHTMRDAFEEVDRALRQFDSKLFFVVIFGPLKAGKSTLTNALAGEWVSPSGFGKETTRRPSIVIAAEESGIDLYYSKDSETNDWLNNSHRVYKDDLDGEKFSKMQDRVRRQFDEVADHIRGVRSIEEIDRVIERKAKELNSANLEEVLTEQVAREPLITVIRCKGGDFLKDGVAIVDMPGLDGRTSNWRCDPLHEWVINRAEFFFFVQSSVAALNAETAEFLREVINDKQKKRPTIWSIQNIFDAEHWRTEEERSQNAHMQKTEGDKRIEELLNFKPRSTEGINLKLAYDGKDHNNKEWLEKSRFGGFEKEFFDILQNERASIQERASLNGLNKSLLNLKDRSKLSLNKIAEFEKEVKDFERKAKIVKNGFAEVDYAKHKKNFLVSFEDKLKDFQLSESANNIITEKFKDLAVEVVDKVPRQEFNDRLDRDLKALVKELARIYSSDEVRFSFIKQCKELADFAEREAMAFFEKQFSDKEIDLEELRPGLPSEAKVPELAIDFADIPGLHLKDNRGYKKFCFVGDNVKVDIARAHLKEIKNRFFEQFEKAFTGWKVRIQEAFLRDYASTRKSELTGIISNMERKFHEENSSRTESIIKYKDLADELPNDLKTLLDTIQKIN